MATKGKTPEKKEYHLAHNLKKEMHQKRICKHYTSNTAKSYVKWTR